MNILINSIDKVPVQEPIDIELFNAGGYEYESGIFIKKEIDLSPIQSPIESSYEQLIKCYK